MLGWKRPDPSLRGLSCKHSGYTATPHIQEKIARGKKRIRQTAVSNTKKAGNAPSEGLQPDQQDAESQEVPVLSLPICIILLAAKAKRQSMLVVDIGQTAR